MQPQPTEVSDFVSYWQSVRAAVEQVPTVATVTTEEDKDPTWRTSSVGWTQPSGLKTSGLMTSGLRTNETRIGGWLIEPRTPATCAVVCGHGYGGRDGASGHELPTGAIGIFPCMPGFHRSAQEGIPNESAGHVIHGIEHRDTYLIRDCVEATWRAFDVLAQRYPHLPLGYLGSSFGGGVGALALPWEPRCAAAALEVPTFGNHPLRLMIPCTGSGESVRLYHHQHPEVTKVLAYYDAAVAAKHIRCPTIVAPAEVDPAVPARGQWSVAEALPGAVIHRLSSGHPTPDAEAAAAWKAYCSFVSKCLFRRTECVQ